MWDSPFLSSISKVWKNPVVDSDLFYGSSEEAIENIVGKGENAVKQNFLFSPQVVWFNIALGRNG